MPWNELLYLVGKIETDLLVFLWISKLLLLTTLSPTTRVVIWGKKTYKTETENKHNQHLKGPKVVGAMIYDNINFSLYPGG
jgi:hypothetical protein